MNSIFGFIEEAKKAKYPWRYKFKIFIKGFKLRIQSHVFGFLKSWNGSEMKNRIYRLFGVKIGKEVFIASGVHIGGLFPELITIEDGSIIGHGATILAHGFTIKHAKIGRVHIGKQVVIGAKAVIECGVTIGDGAVVAINSVVNKDVLFLFWHV